MISFFRRLRQKLLSENKFARYLLYALGEIVLVVIGILIALSINNWNQQRIKSDKEEAYLINLDRDLDNQLVSIDIQIEYEQKYIDAAKPVLDGYHSTSTLYIDSLTSYRLQVLMERKTFVRTDPTYEELISTGNIDVLKNSDLRNSLLEYYQELERVEKVIQNNNTLNIDQLYGHDIITSVYVGNETSAKLYDISNELLKDPEHELLLLNLISRRSFIASRHLVYMEELRAKTVDMIELLRGNEFKMKNAELRMPKHWDLGLG
jgi:hypothetical protein